MMNFTLQSFHTSWRENHSRHTAWSSFLLWPAVWPRSSTTQAPTPPSECASICWFLPHPKWTVERTSIFPCHMREGVGGGGRWTYPPPPKLSINTFHWRLHGLAKSSFSAVSHLLLFHSLCMWPTVNISICLDYIRFLYIHFHQLCHNQSYRSSV